jgi:arginine exporter protein ArgO
MVCFFVGVVALALGTLGVHLLSEALAWNLIVVGLVGRVVMRVMRGGEGI